MVSLTTSVIVTGMACLLAAPEMTPLAGLVGFAIAGVVGPAIGRSAAMAGVDSLGASVSVPLQGSVYPIAGVMAAVLFLGETVAPLHAIGAAIIVFGVWLLARRPEMVPGKGASRQRRGAMPAVFFPLLAGISYGAGDVLRKQAVDVLPSPLFGAFIGMASALLVWCVIAVSVQRVRHRITPIRRHHGWFVLAGALAATAVILTINALHAGHVSVVTPIVAAQPLPILVFSAVFLKQHETVDWRIAAGAIAIVGGTTIVSLAG